MGCIFAPVASQSSCAVCVFPALKEIMNRNRPASRSVRRLSRRNAFQPTPYALWFALLIVLVLSACGGLGGEPRIVATLPPQVQSPTAAPPVDQPELMRGAAIFAENCTRCHGEGGRGDGELALTGQLPTPPRDFTDPATTRDQTVAAWFEVITNGRLETLMPPWRDSLSESDRWAVAMYSYTLSYHPDQLAQGEAVWGANCAACHGETGAGDGARAAEFETVTNLTQLAALVDASDAAIVDMLTNADDGDPHAFGDSLDEAERWAVVAFARTLALDNTEVIESDAPAETATAEAEVANAPQAQGAVRGQVVNGTLGSAVMTGLNVTLRIFDSALNQETYETTVSADGSFSFEYVSISPDRAYIATTLYQDRTFSSDMVSGDPSAGALELPITVYETTNDPSVISINSFVAQIVEADGSLQVAQLVRFSNASNTIFSLDDTIEGDRHPSVSVPLPEGAEIINTADDPNRYTLSSDGRTLIDTLPVYPGQNHLVHVIYSVPYSGSARVELPVDYPLQGLVRLLVEPGRLSIRSDQLPSLGTQTLGNAAVEAFGAEMSLPAGSVLNYEITGAATQPGLVLEGNLLPYVLIAAGGAAILISAALYYLGRRTPAPAADDDRLRQMLIEQIAELDDLNQKGQIDPAAYKERRDRLKARLIDLVKDKPQRGK